MADMNGTISIGKGGCDKISFKILHDIDNEILAFFKVSKDNKFSLFALRPPLLAPQPP
jgi:hypothetical protein